MANNYDFMFKFIIIGDSSIFCPYCRCRKVLSTSQVHRRPIQKWSLTHPRSRIRLQKYQYQQYEHQNTNMGYSITFYIIRLAKSLLSQSLVPTIKVQSQLSLFLISQNVIVLRISTNGFSKSRTTRTIKYKR